ncbi:hypothetical protein [Methyloceanibacter sp.]|uniref:hypothetical protein n=1 Tax=Methyloceanibacter sp. TaxID=1965321 RepID=UPI002C81BFC9|nr:hypothetical protein [Methyloceanibacter sp.]HML92077.1 hypothetical protein [Methyloceanibacter sp.]
MNTTRFDSVVNAARSSVPSRPVDVQPRPSNLLHGALDGEEEDEAFQHRGMTVCLIELLEERLPPLARGRPRRTDAPASSAELALTCLEVS